MLNRREKYGSIALRAATGSNLSDEPTEIRPGWFVSGVPPWDLPEHWTKWIGTIRSTRLENASLWLVCTGGSEAPGVLDADNQELEERVRRWLYSLTLTDYSILHGEPVRLTGAYREDGIDVRSLGEIRPFHFFFGTPLTRVTRERLEHAASIAAQLDDLPSNEQFSRFARTVRSFFEGMHASNAGRRLHLFFRVLEGLILPGPGQMRRRIKARTELFLGPHYHDEVERWFRMRSAVEHLHAPHEISALKHLDLRDRLIEVTKAGYLLEGVARECLRRIILTPSFREHFASEECIRSFWALEDTERNALWGDPLDLEMLEEKFDATRIHDSDLGLS